MLPTAKTQLKKPQPLQRLRPRNKPVLLTNNLNHNAI